MADRPLHGPHVTRFGVWQGKHVQVIDEHSAGGQSATTHIPDKVDLMGLTPSHSSLRVVPWSGRRRAYLFLCGLWMSFAHGRSAPELDVRVIP